MPQGSGNHNKEYIVSVTLKAQRGIAWDEDKFGVLVSEKGINSPQKATAERSEEDLVTGAMLTGIKIVKHLLDADPGNVAAYVYRDGNTIAIEAATLDTEEDIVAIGISVGRATVVAKAPARKVAPQKKAPAKPPVKRATPAGTSKAPARKTAPPVKKAAAKAPATPVKKAAPAKAVAAKKAPAKAPVGRKTTPPRKAGAAKK